MKRSIIAFMLLLTVSAMASAQTGLEINQIFNGKYAGDPKVTETMISGSSFCDIMTSTCFPRSKVRR